MWMSLLTSWLILTVGFLVAAGVVSGFQVKGFKNALVAAAIFGVLNVCIGWLIIGTIIVGTLGLGLLLSFVTRVFTNAILLKITDAITDRLTIRSFGSALVAAIVISVVGTIGDWIFRSGYQYR